MVTAWYAVVDMYEPSSSEDTLGQRQQSTLTASRNASAEAKAWIVALPSFTLFRSDAVPGPRNAVASLLSRLLARPHPIVGRIAKGLYWRQPPPVHPLYGQPPTSAARIGQAYLPSGSGLSGYSALEATCLSTQVPVRTAFAVLSLDLTLPQLPGRGATLVLRRNTRRAELTWHEVTLLEACLAFSLSDCRSWDHAISNIARYLPRRGGSTPIIRRDALRWAAQTEAPHTDQLLPPGDDRRFCSVVERLARDLPDHLFPAGI